MRTFAPPASLSTGSHGDVEPSLNFQRYCHVSAVPGSRNEATCSTAVVPSSPGDGFVVAPNTVGATLSTRRFAASLAVSGVMLTSRHSKSTGPTRYVNETGE